MSQQSVWQDYQVMTLQMSGQLHQVAVCMLWNMYPKTLVSMRRCCADCQAGQAPSPQSPDSTLPSASHDPAVVQQQSVASGLLAPAPPSVHAWRVATRSKRRATPLYTGLSHERAQPQACSQEHGRDPKRQRGAYAILKCCLMALLLSRRQLVSVGGSATDHAEIVLRHRRSPATQSRRHTSSDLHREACLPQQ